MNAAGKEQSMLILLMVLFFAVIGVGIHLAWTVTKFVIGLGLFCFFPIAFVLLVLLGAFSSLWLPILIVGLLLSICFRRV